MCAEEISEGDVEDPLQFQGRKGIRHRELKLSPHIPGWMASTLLRFLQMDAQ